MLYNSFAIKVSILMCAIHTALMPDASRPAEPVLSIPAHANSVTCITFSPDGKTLATGCGNLLLSNSGEAKMWDASTGKQIWAVQQPDEICALAFMMNGKQLLLGSRGQPITVWDVSTGMMVRDTKKIGAGNRVAIFLRSHLLASASETEVVLLDYTTAQGLRSFEGHSRSIQTVVFSPDGATLASGSSDKTIILWDVASGKARATLKGHSDEVLSVSFSPDGATLASGSSDKTIILWDVASGKARASLRGHNAGIGVVAFSINGSILASGSSTGEVKVWHLK